MAWVVERITEAFDCNSRVLLLASFSRFSCLSYRIRTRHSLSSSSPLVLRAIPDTGSCVAPASVDRLARYISEGSGCSFRSVRLGRFRFGKARGVVFPFLFGPTTEVSVCRITLTFFGFLLPASGIGSPILIFPELVFPSSLVPFGSSLRPFPPALVRLLPSLRCLGFPDVRCLFS